jgi:outer membrane receptor protein involved in Fe transport
LALDAAGYADLLAHYIVGPANPVGDPVVHYSSQFKTNFVNYQASLDYRATKDVLLYTSFKKGVKAGGFNNGLVNFSVFDLAAIPFQNETNYANELGLKWSSSDHKLRINPSVFYYNYKNYQATAFTVVAGSLGVQVVNKDAKAYGGEVEVFANPLNGLDLYFGAGYVHTKVKDITNSGAGVAITSDRELGQAPHFQSTGMIRYAAPFWNDGSLTNQVSYNYIGSRFVDVLNDPATKLPAHLNVDYALTYRPGGNKSWYVTAYAKNALNSTNATQKFNFASLFQTGQVNYFPPRFMGVEVGASW